MLTPEQIEKRKGKLTASRIACLMQGDAEKIMRLYREMIGEEQPEDLSKIWPVRLGEATEHLNMDWYEMNGGLPVTRRGEVVVHPTIPWAACTLDGFDNEIPCAVEGKHVGGREPLEVVIERYQPQCQWIMLVTGTMSCALSVIQGASPPVVEYIDAEPEYQAEMVRRGRQFMACVMQRREPVVLEPMSAPTMADKVYEMDTNNHWVSAAADWLENKSAANKAKDAEKILKSLVPEDAKKAHGAKVQITRDRAGRLSLRESVE